MSKTNDRREPARATQEAIAQRAYELFLQRGSVSGYELDDWLQAEAELTADAARQAESDATDDEPAESSTGRSGGRRTGGRDRAPSRRTIRP